MRRRVFIIGLVLFSAIPFVVNGQCSDVRGGTIVANDSTICEGETIQLTYLGAQGSYTWLSSVSGAEVWMPVGTGDSILVDAPTTNYDYKVHMSNGLPECTDTSDVLTIQTSTFAQTPSPGFGGPECGNKFIPIATTSGMALEYWSQISGPGTAAFYPDENSPAQDSVKVDAFGVYELAWHISDGICTKSDTIEFTAIERPIADAGGNADFCDNTFLLNASYSLLGTSGEWSKSSAGTFNFIDNTEPNTSVNANIGTHTITWKEMVTSYPSCYSEETITIRVAANPTANAGDDGNECDTSFTFNAIPSIGAGFWELISDTRSVFFDNLSQSNTTVSVEEYGENYVFQWKEVNSFCSDSDTVVVNFYEQPLAVADSPDDICGNNTTLTARPSVGSATGEWFYKSGLNSTAPDRVNDSVANVSIGDQYGAYTYEWKEVNGVCRDSMDVTLRFVEQPVANAGIGGDTCGLNYSISAMPSVGDGEWLLVNDTGTLEYLQGQNSAVTQIEARVYGRYILQWKEVNDICEDISPEIYVDFNEQPVVAPFDSSISCGLSYVITTTKSVEGSTVGWDTPNITTSDSIVWVSNVSVPGEYSFLWTETNGECWDTASAFVRFIEQPEADIISDDSVACSPELELMTETSPGQGLWEVLSGNGTLIFSPDINSHDVTITSDTLGEFLVKWTLINEICSNADSMLITFSELPEINAGPDQNLDNEFETTMQAELLENLTGAWFLVDGTGDFGNENSPESSVYNLSLGENIFSWEVRNGECFGTDSVSIFVYDIFIPDVITPNGDNDNDYFEIRGIENVARAEVTIFNRWGGEVFYSSDYNNEWDGTGKSGEVLTNDTYFYVVSVDNDQRVFKGYVMINK